MPARTCNLLADLAGSGLAVKILDYRWDHNERVSARQEEFVLCYRPSPGDVSFAADLEHGKTQSFGQLMFFPARTDLQTTPAALSERSRNVVCRFAYDWFQPVFSEEHRWKEEDLARCYDLRNFRIEQAMQRLGAEAASPGFASEMMVESIARMITVEIARHFRSNDNAHRVRTYEGQFSTSELTRIYDYIDSVVNRCPTISEISRKCGVSSAHLRRSFKQTTGRTLYQYVANARLKKAQTMLAETDLPLKDVAYRLGFASSSTFSSTFKRTSGETPSSYRQRQHRHI